MVHSAITFVFPVMKECMHSSLCKLLITDAAQRVQSKVRTLDQRTIITLSQLNSYASQVIWAIQWLLHFICFTTNSAEYLSHTERYELSALKIGLRET